MDEYKHTVESVKKDILRYELTQKEARERLCEIRDNINELIECTDDVKRIQIFGKLEELLVVGWATFDRVLYWSKIANADSSELRAAYMKREGYLI